MQSSDLASLIEPTITACQAELEEVRIVAAGKRRVVKITVDADGASGSGLSLDEISDITRAVSAFLDQSDVMGSQPYLLEVSTRGACAPLSRPAHYRRNRGRLVEICCNDGRQLLGRIVRSDDEKVVISCEKTDELCIDYSQIRQAVIQLEMNRSTNAAEEN